MHRVGLRRILLILAILVISVSALARQSFDINLRGLHLDRGSNAILGLKLGLDLQGGALLVYQAVPPQEITATFQDPPDEQGVAVIRALLDDLGKTEATYEVDDRVLSIRVSSLRGEKRDSEGVVLRRNEADVLRETLATRVGPLVPDSYTARDAEDPTTDQMEGVKLTVEKRINPFGVTEPVIQLMGSNRLLVELPGIDDVEEVKRLIGQTARLEFRERTCRPGLDCDTLEGHEPDKETGLTGDDLARAFASTHPQKGVPTVSLQFNSRGTRLFREMTTRLFGTPNRFVIYLDDDELIAPVVIQPILTGNSFIEGPTFTPTSVRTLAIQLESGRLPIPIKVVQQQDVDATLGAESLRKSLIAGAAGLSLVLLFMVLYYRAVGVVAALALVVYTATVLAIFKLVPVTLTLAGAAAFVLSIGMAVDANILIFERMKEELRLGRTVGAAIEIGFGRAWPSIRDSNLSTFITCAILFWFGQRLGVSVVSGFGLTLFIGVAVSMFSALTVTRALLHLMAATGLGHRRRWFTPEPLPSPAPGTLPGMAEEGD